MAQPFPNDDPNIKISFNGLLVLYNDRFRVVKVGVHHETKDHKFKINVKANGEKRWQEFLMPADCARINLNVNDPVSGVLEHRPLADGKVDEHDLTYAIDLNGEKFHNKNAKFKRGKSLSPGMHIYAGTFYTDDNFPAKVGRRGGTLTSTPTAYVIGANIYLKSSNTSKAALTYIKKISGEEITLFDFDKRKKYAVKVTNREDHIVPGTVDFGHWYDVFTDPTGKKFTVEPVPPPVVGDHDNPCNPIFISQPNPLP